jgi:hypothetical protein
VPLLGLRETRENTIPSTYYIVQGQRAEAMARAKMHVLLLLLIWGSTVVIGARVMKESNFTVEMHRRRYALENGLGRTPQMGYILTSFT